MAPEDTTDLLAKIGALSPKDQARLLDELMQRLGPTGPIELPNARLPFLAPAPRRVHSLHIRIDLVGAKPPVWRRIVVPGDLRLDRLDLVIQAAMGWQNSHLHRFRIGSRGAGAHFLTDFDLQEGEEGVAEAAVRVDQVLRLVGDRLSYDYDFGDGWEHLLKVERVIADSGTLPTVIAGRRACPPEDVGGISGYEEMAAWVESGCDPHQLPENFDTLQDALDWLPNDWHPANFDSDSANRRIAELSEI